MPVQQPGQGSQGFPGPQQGPAQFGMPQGQANFQQGPSNMQPVQYGRF